MSDLFHVEVKSIEGATARVHFDVVHPDQSCVPAAPNFALQVVTELYWLERERYLFDFDRDEAHRLAASHPRRDDLEAWLEMAHGRKVWIDEAEHDALKTASVGRMREEGLGALGFANGRYYKQYHSDYESFRLVAASVVREVHLEDEGISRLVGENFPAATLAFTVDDPALLSHFRAGMTWQSAMYDFEGW